MALVNPQIAMSYRPTTEYQPRNALAEYAQLQSIVGAQRQAEVADMQLEKYRQDRAALDNIRRAIVAKGGPPDLEAAAEEMIKSGNPDYIERGAAIRETIRSQRQWEDYQRGRTGTAAGAPAGAAPGAGVTPSFRIAGKDVPMGTLGTGTFDSADALDIGVVPPQRPPLSAEDKAAVVAGMGPSGLKAGMREYLTELNVGRSTGLNAPQIAAVLRANPDERAALERALPSMKIPGVSAGQVPAFSQLSRDLLSPETRAAQDFNYAPSLPASAFAPAAAPAANVLAAQQGAAPPESVNQLAAAAPNLQSLLSDYRRVSGINRPEAKAEAQLLLKQIEEAMQSSRAPETIRKMRELGFPITKEGFAEFSRTSQAQAGPRVDIIGVVKGTDTPVYFDKDTRQQFTIGVDATGKQVPVPYTGGINRSTSNVTATASAVGGRLESAEQKGKGELNVKQYGDIATAARLAARTLPAMETQAKILDQGFTTGFGTEVKKAGASLLAALGVKEAEKFATDAQTFLSATQQAVLQRQLEQKGPQTEADAQRITQTGAQFGNTVAANRFIIDVAKAQLQRDIAQRNFYDDWWANKKTYEGAENAWFSGEGGKSLFDRPELKKYLASPSAGAGSAGAAQAIPQAAIDALKAGRGTDAQFDAIFGAGAAKRARGQ